MIPHSFTPEPISIGPMSANVKNAAMSGISAFFPFLGRQIGFLMAKHFLMPIDEPFLSPRDAFPFLIGSRFPLELTATSSKSHSDVSAMSENGYKRIVPCFFLV